MHTLGPKMGARLMRPLDPGGEHRLRRKNGTHHKDLEHPSEPLGAHMRTVS